MNFYQLGLNIEELPLQWPLAQSSSRLRAIIRLEDNLGFQHAIELAPYPGVHPESLSEAIACWNQSITPMLKKVSFHAELWQWNKPWFGLGPEQACQYSSVQTAAEQLLLSLAQKHLMGVVREALPRRLPGSALLRLPSAMDQDHSWQEFLQLWQAGFRVFKCKITPNFVEEQLNFMLRMQSHGLGELQLRLDANQGLSAHDLMQWQKSRHLLAVTYWEESEASSSSQVLQPEAADESLWDQAPGAAGHNCAIWVLKPSRLGLAGFVAWLQAAEQQGRIAILSNAFDSGLSMRCYLWLYAHFSKNLAALGFGTARYLPEDAWRNHEWGGPWVLSPRLPFA